MSSGGKVHPSCPEPSSPCCEEREQVTWVETRTGDTFINLQSGSTRGPRPGFSLSSALGEGRGLTFNMSPSYSRAERSFGSSLGHGHARPCQGHAGNKAQRRRNKQGLSPVQRVSLCLSNRTELLHYK